MTNPITIERIADHVGERVTIRGWLYDLTPKGKLLFLRLRDGTGLTQGVVYRPNVGDELFERLAHLGQESSLIVTGVVRANDRAPMAVVAAEVGVGDQARFEVVRVLPRQIKRGGKGLGNVAGRTDPLADDDVVGLP